MEFVPNRIKRRIPTEVEGIGKLRPYLEPGKRRSKYITGQAPSAGKLVPSLRAAIEQVGLKDGMTISFHHHLRNGDLVLPQVMAEIAAMGIRDLTLCSSSLSKNHTCLIDYIRSGVITGIETSGGGHLQGVHPAQARGVQDPRRPGPLHRTGGAED